MKGDTPCPVCGPDAGADCPFDMTPRVGDAACFEQGFINALHVGNMVAAVEILEGLASIDLPRATEVYQAIQDGLTLARLSTFTLVLNADRVRALKLAADGITVPLPGGA